MDNDKFIRDPIKHKDGAVDIAVKREDQQCPTHRVLFCVHDGRALGGVQSCHVSFGSR